jgi:endonuclease VIII
VPEGDTLFRTAVTLRRVLVGRPLRRVYSPLPAIVRAGLESRVVAAVESRGKHLLIRLDDGRVLHTHLGMKGSFHLYRPAEFSIGRGPALRLVLETDERVVACFNAPTVELVGARELGRHPRLATLGPDLLSPDFDAAEARRRLRELGRLTIAEALMRQSALAGVGNVYKSETLFLCQTNPFAPVVELSDETLDRLVRTSRELLRRNASGFPRATRRTLGGARVWVYRRSGEPCLRCGATVRMRRHGTTARSTYFCPSCQSVA